jgi:hypothetical protein
MKSKNPLTYYKGDIIIKFYPCPYPSGSKKRPRYTFAVDGNDELTQQLKTSIKSDKVVRSQVKILASRLFCLIENPDIMMFDQEKIKKSQEVERLYNFFRKKYRENPKFKIIDIVSRYVVRLVNSNLKCLGICVFFSADSKQARADALRKLFEKLDKKKSNKIKKNLKNSY